MDDLEGFEILLLETIDKTFNYCLGETNTKLIYNYLEQKHCPKKEIPKMLDFFSDELEKIVGSGRGQMMGAAKILENTIIEELCRRMEIREDYKTSGYFPDQVRRLKERYIQQKNVR